MQLQCGGVGINISGKPFDAFSFLNTTHPNTMLLPKEQKYPNLRLEICLWPPTTALEQIPHLKLVGDKHHHGD